VLGERKLQLLLRGMTGGRVSERDRLLHYTVGEFYQELSLFLEEGQRREKQLEEIRNKTKT
jgi:hypothetical protein